MKIPLMLQKALLADARGCLDLVVTHDYRVICSRVKHEGLSFLTITLPLLSDALERGLEDGRFTCPTGFRRAGSLPLLLGGFFKRVFNERDGNLLNDPCVESIRWIRQLTRFWKKLKLPCSQIRNEKAVARYIEVEEELRSRTKEINKHDTVLDTVSRMLWGKVFRDFDPYSIMCRHGPGATAEKYTALSRREIKQWYDRSEISFPSDLHAFHDFGWHRYGKASSFVDNGLRYLPVSEEPSVRVVFVPKTLTTPRVIAIEPHNMQFVQQALGRYMMETIEADSLCRGVRFYSQTENQTRARIASINRVDCTIDLSDASDRVHLNLVERIFRHSPILDYLFDARSLHATLPNGKNVILSKFASMGSALCFPVEACVFFTLVLSAIFSKEGGVITYGRIRRLAARVCVFGDDIICPNEHYATVSDYLESYLLKVNRHKSFSGSLFRESCGGDYFKGETVKPVYAREFPPDNPKLWTANTLMSWCSTANQLYEAGMWRTCQMLRDMLQSTQKGVIPLAVKPDGGLCFKSFFQTTNCRYDVHLQSFRQKRSSFVPVSQPDPGAKSFTGMLNYYFESTKRPTSAWSAYLDEGFEKSFTHSTKRGAFKSKRRWFPVNPG